MSKLATTLFVSAALVFGTLAGCERKEEVLDVETPEGEMEVERAPETGETDIEVERDPLE